MEGGTTIDPQGGEAKRQDGRVPGRVPVLLPLPLAGPYDYAVPEGWDATPGTLVTAPLGGRTLAGVVWHGEADGGVAAAKLRPLSALLPAPPMTAPLMRFIDWVAHWTLSPPGAVLRMALSVPGALTPPPRRPGVMLGEGVDAASLPPSRARVAAVLAEAPVPWAASDLARAAGVGVGVIKAMRDAGLLIPALLPRDAERPDLSAGTPPLLSPAQAAAAASLRAAVVRGGSGATLLDGVTGSGKTEVYLEAVAEAVARGRQALVLLPEIALSAQVIARFRQRFGTDPFVWHSEVTGARRRDTWRAVAEGRAPIVVGARSALFLPFPDLGLIVVDEEHETAFKQEDGVAYHARDMALVRAHLTDIPAVLVSATPSLETLANVERGRHQRLHLPERHGSAGMPDVGVIDLRATPPARGHFIAPPLATAITETLARGEQALLFLNRRGFAPLTLCRACGHRFQCPNCTAWLVEHRYLRRLECHHCGHAEPVPPACPECGAEGSLTPVGPGVERIAAECRDRFEGVRIAEMSSDTIHGAAGAAHYATMIEKREVDLIIGTQLVAKGWHFPHLTLVGVVDADLGLAGGDLRAAERSFQVLHQVGGRAGRAEHAGRVLLQTWSPDHAVMRALVSGDVDRFVAEEMEERRAGGWPPFGRLAAIIVSSPDGAVADEAASALRATAPEGEGFRILGPAPAPLSILRGQHRRRLLLKASRGIDVQALLGDWLARTTVPRAARIDVDVDPVSFL
ncbi:primosomal protein N' [Elioraea sp.]|uniref:primosomal protein N' n=1 Tax=Elioraea sp. TaxID=2185103 RepID=UPI0038D17BD1